MRISLQTMVVLFVMLSCSVVFSQIGVGEPVIDLSAGKKKSINFPHKTHQQTLKDCSICHSIFPQEKDSIKNMIDKGELKKKVVMKKCKSCHKKMKKANQKTGPVSCGSCHTGK